MEKGLRDVIFYARILVAALADAIADFEGVEVEDPLARVLEAACVFDKEYGADGAE